MKPLTMTADLVPCEPSVLAEDVEDDLDQFDPEELVGSAEIAKRLRVKPRTVIIWSQRTQRGEMEGAPFPAAVQATGRYKYRWGDVVAWHRRRLATLAGGPRERALGHEDRVAELGWTGPGGKRAEAMTKADLARIARLKSDLVEVQARLDAGAGVTPKTVADLERQLADARDVVANRGTDSRRRAELFASLHDAGVSWDAIGAFIGKAGHVPREAVRAMRKREGS